MNPRSPGAGGPQGPPAPDFSMRDEIFERLMDRLTVLRGFSERLLEGTFGPVSADQKRILGEMIFEADELRLLLFRDSSPLKAPAARPRY